MSNSTASLRRRIHSAQDLQSVVRTMKALASSSIGQYEKAVRALADYYRTVELGLGACFREMDPGALPIESAAKARPRGVGAVVFGSDQGLVGRFNQVVADYAMEGLAASPGKPHLWAVGERVHGCLAAAGLAPTGLFAVPGSVQTIAPLIGEILTETERYQEQGQVSELHLFYNRPTSGAGYAPVGQRLLPLDEKWRRNLTDLPWPTGARPEVMGDATDTSRALVRGYLFISLFRACAESLASENASRLAAMERADRNIDDVLETLHGRFHRLRQSSIDEELFDVVAGFEALTAPRRVTGATGCRD